MNTDTVTKTKFVDIDDIEKTEIGAVYVINTTPPNKRSMVSFVVAKTSGNGSDRIVVPAITLPIDLTAQVTKRQLVASSEFRRAVALGFIQPITKEYYNELMSKDPESRRIVQRALTNVDRAPDDQKNPQAEAAEEEDQNRGVSPRYVVLAQQLKDGDITERGLISDIKTNGDMTQAEARFLWRETKESGHKMLRDYIAEVRDQNNW